MDFKLAVSMGDDFASPRCASAFGGFGFRALGFGGPYRLSAAGTGEGKIPQFRHIGAPDSCDLLWILAVCTALNF